MSFEDTGSIRTAMHGQTLVLTLCNPSLKNALSPAMYAAAIEALTVASDNAAVKSVVLAGDAGVFCAGGNLHRLLHNRSLDQSVQAASIDQLHNWIDEIRSFPKPVVAAVEGAAAGAGFSLVLACDLVVAASNAVFAMSYSAVGLSADGGGSWHLARALPRALASEVLMGAGKLSAAQLQQWGLVNRVVEPHTALAQALAWCEQLNAKAPNALESAKDLLRAAPTQDLQAHMLMERDHFVANLHHANGAEGIGAFLEKRPAKYL